MWHEAMSSGSPWSVKWAMLCTRQIEEPGRCCHHRCRLLLVLVPLPRRAVALLVLLPASSRRMTTPAERVFFVPGTGLAIQGWALRVTQRHTQQQQRAPKHHKNTIRQPTLGARRWVGGLGAVGATSWVGSVCRPYRRRRAFCDPGSTDTGLLLPVQTSTRAPLSRTSATSSNPQG